VHNLYKDLADGKIDDPRLASKVEAMVPSAGTAQSDTLLPAAKPVAAKAVPKAKGKLGLKGFGILKKKGKPAAAATQVPAIPEAVPAMGVAQGMNAKAMGKLDRKMKLEMLLKDLIRTVRLKRSRNILREAFKDGKEENFDDAWQKQILGRILARNEYTMESLGNAFHEFQDDSDVKTLRTGYEQGMVHFRNLVMEETFKR